MFTFEPFRLLALVFITSIIPGAAVAFPLLRKSDLDLVEKLIIAFALGIILPGFLFTLEAMAGIPFSLMLVFANIFIITLIGVALAYKEGMFAEMEFKAPQIPKLRTGDDIIALIDKLWIPLVLVLLVSLAFWVRFQSYTPIYQELDPYYYLYGTEEIMVHGIMPLRDDTAWYPLDVSSHRVAPDKMYMEAQWYALYTAGGSFEKYLLSAVASIYPAVAAAFLAFAAYLLVSQEYGRKLGLVAAGIMAFLPITILKMAAGVSEIQPFGLFVLFMFFATYLMAMRKKTIELAVLAGLFYSAVILGSVVGIVANMVLFAFIAIYAVLLFLKGEKLMDFIKTNAVLLAFVIFSSWLMGLYNSGSLFSGIISSGVLLIAGAIVFALVLEQLSRLKDKEMKMFAVAGIAIIVLFSLLFTPIGDKFRDYGRTAVGTAAFLEPLDRTIAEQGAAGTSFEGELGFIGARLSCEKDALGEDAYISCMKAKYTGLQAQGAAVPDSDTDFIGGIFKPFTMLGNLLLGALDVALGGIFKLDLKTSIKENSLAMFFFIGAILAAIAGIARMFFVKHERKDAALPMAFLLLALIILPISYVGFNKIKYTVFLGLAIAFASVFFLAEIEKVLEAAFAKRKAEDEFKVYVLSAIILLGFSLVFLEAFASGGWGGNIALNSVQTRFQDNPVAVQPKFAALCSELRAQGAYDATICGVGDDAANYSSASLENQFNTQLCYLSIIDDYKNVTDAERMGVSYRCSKLASYWLDSMEWISENTNESDRITSWWDYGHWINYFGQRKTVLRNEHASHEMIGEVAHAYIGGTPEELKASMKKFDSKYVIFDGELIMSGNGFGGKYGALNYLGCAWDNQTNVSYSPGTSQCEWDHMFETIYVPNMNKEECTISEAQNIKGFIAYAVERTTSGGKVSTILKPRYCIGTAKLIDGRDISPATYYLDRTTPDGDLVLNKAILQLQEQYTDMNLYSAFYTKDQIWQGGNSTVLSGWEDRKGKFYDSMLYQGFFLKQVPGFTLAYQTSDGAVKIYKMN